MKKFFVDAGNPESAEGAEHLCVQGRVVLIDAGRVFGVCAPRGRWQFDDLDHQGGESSWTLGITS